jgi:hypothetical protein
MEVGSGENVLVSVASVAEKMRMAAGSLRRGAISADAGGKRKGKEGRMFFFEKKNQKTFPTCTRAGIPGTRASE